MYADHPAVWSAYFEGCNGKKQSPIDIPLKKAKKRRLTRSPSAAPTSLTSREHSSTMDTLVRLSIDSPLITCIHTLLFTVEFDAFETTKVDLKKVPNFSGGPVGKDVYQFLQFHFHWGSKDKQGSEHTVDGKR